jgi:hypothetical protein
MVAVTPETYAPKHIRGGWSHHTDTTHQQTSCWLWPGHKIWSLSNTGFKPVTFRLLAQCANHALTQGPYTRGMNKRNHLGVNIHHDYFLNLNSFAIKMEKKKL